MDKNGFTLIEAMIVIAVLSILAALVLPSFQSLIRKQQVSGEVNVLVSLVYLARSEAIKRNSVVTICKSNDAEQCGGSWSDGWILFQDNDKDGSRDVGEVLISSGVIEHNFILSWSAFGSNNYIRFTSQGLTLSQNGTFKLCPSDGDARYARAVIISKTARARLSKDNDSDGVHESASGNNLTCA